MHRQRLEQRLKEFDFKHRDGVDAFLKQRAAAALVKHAYKQARFADELPAHILDRAPRLLGHDRTWIPDQSRACLQQRLVQIRVEDDRKKYARATESFHGSCASGWLEQHAP